MMVCSNPGLIDNSLIKVAATIATSFLPELHTLSLTAGSGDCQSHDLLENCHDARVLLDTA